MADVITGLTDDDIATEWRHERASEVADDDGTDGTGGDDGDHGQEGERNRNEHDGNRPERDGVERGADHSLLPATASVFDGG